MGTTNSQTPIGSANDVQLVNAGAVGQYNNLLGGAMSGFGSRLGSVGSNAMSAFGRVSDTAQNYENYIRQMMGGGGVFDTLRNSTQGFDPTSAMNQFMSIQPQLAQIAQGSADTALSPLYDSGRAQAQAAGNDARRSAANDLAAAGLLSSGGAVGAMTEATVNPMLQMETNLAGQRSQYLGNMLGQLQGGAMSSLSGAYGQNLGLAGQIAGLGLGGMQGQTQALGAGAQGMGSLASLYGGLYGQGLGYGAQMAAPEYWQPQYNNDESGWNWSGGLAGAASGAALGSAIPLLGTGLGAGIGGLIGLFG